VGYRPVVALIDRRLYEIGSDIKTILRVMDK